MHLFSSISAAHVLLYKLVVDRIHFFKIIQKALLGLGVFSKIIQSHILVLYHPNKSSSVSFEKNSGEKSYILREAELIGQITLLSELGVEMQYLELGKFTAAAAAAPVKKKSLFLVVVVMAVLVDLHMKGRRLPGRHQPKCSVTPKFAAAASSGILCWLVTTFL